MKTRDILLTLAATIAGGLILDEIRARKAAAKLKEQYG